MEQTTFFDHYRIDSNDEELAQPVSRSGPAINYKAIDTRTNERVLLQLISRATLDPEKSEQFQDRARTVQKIDHVNIARVLDVGSDDDHVGLVSEYVEGETADAWLVANGPMPADAVLRIALQVVRGLGAAAFFGLTHQAIEPANILIIPGQTADGGWPFIKLINFGLAGLETHSNGDGGHELASKSAPHFASPEQLLHKPVDFRSEMYSLGATMCFLLTGAVPLAVGGMKVRLRARRLPELRRAPGALRKLLVHMLHENPDDRPQDPVAFEAEIRECLTKVERRQALGRKLGLPLGVTTPRKARATSLAEASPASQVGRGILAFAALLLLGGIVAAFFIPEDALPFRRNRSAADIGVPVGVPSPGQRQNPGAPALAANQALPANSPTTGNTPNPDAPPPNVATVAAVNAAPASSPGLAEQQNQANTPAPAGTAAPQVADNEVASAPAPAPPSPAEGPGQSDNRASGSDQTDSSSHRQTTDNQPQETTAKSGDEEDANASSTGRASSSSTHARKRTTTSSSRRLTNRDAGNDNDSRLPRTRPGEVHARFMGMTPDGRMILRLPSGRTVAVRPGQPDEDINVGQPTHRRRIIRREPDEQDQDQDIPYQPFDPDNPRD